MIKNHSLASKPIPLSKSTPANIKHLQSQNCSLLIDVSVDSIPSICYWGQKLEQTIDLQQFALLIDRPTAQACLDNEANLSLLPEAGLGFQGHPGLIGHSNRQHWNTQFTDTEIEETDNALTIYCRDSIAKLRWQLTLILDPLTDVLELSQSLTNHGASDYQLQQLCYTLPLPINCCELLSLGGRWSHEFTPQRHLLKQGAYSRENRTGRTSHQHFPGLMIGTQSFSEQQGSVYGAHLAWSGNHQLRVEKLFDGRQYLQAGELLEAGEIMLTTGESYQAPSLYCCFSRIGIQGVSDAFHKHLRQIIPYHAEKEQPKPRPVHLNTWEAMYFQHNPQCIEEMIDSAAKLGVERFILDDGWFIHRHGERSGLGDWQVDREKFPNGLQPIIDKASNAAMEFGLWFEPEMVNPDSDLYRQHPDWILQIENLKQPLGRYQYVLNLCLPEVFNYLFERLDHFLSQYSIHYIKWDMNRNLVHSAHKGIASTHQQVLACYRLMAKVRESHPLVEIEACASGGARADFAMLKHCNRIWTSDCNDALERQQIQRYFSYFFPPEVMGAHIGPSTSHTTGRKHSMSFRAITALFGHLGIECDPAALCDNERKELTYYIDLYKKYRPLLHRGRSVFLQPADQSAMAQGCVSIDQCSALFCYVQLSLPEYSIAPRLQFFGLAKDKNYRVRFLNYSPYEQGAELTKKQAQCMKRLPQSTGNSLSVFQGELLRMIGLQLPIIHPETALLIALEEHLDD